MTDTETKSSLKDSTIQMYEKTIKEMKENGFDTSRIEKEMEYTIEAYERPEKPNEQYCYNGEQIVTEPKFESIDFLLQNLFVVRFFDVPEYIIRRVLFVDDNKMKIGFYETSSFCVYDYIKKNKKKLNGTFSIEYLDRTGALLRIDTFELKSIKKIKQFQLDYTSGCPVYVEIELKYKNHGISTK